MQTQSRPHAGHPSAYPTHPAPAMPPRAITKQYPLIEDRYVLSEVMTWGGLSTLFIATDIKTDTDVVLKTIGKGFREDPGSYGAMKRTLSVEAEALSRIKHDGVVSLISRPSSDDYIVMEYVSGPTFRQMRHHAEGVLMLALDLCDALSAAHAAGVIHRDLKPDNVIVSPRITSNIALIDFGSAKLDSPDFDDPYFSSAVGTAEYMSPEAAESGFYADKRSDTYSLAAMLYDSLASVPPFGIDPDADFSTAVEIRKSQKPLPLSQAVPGLSRRICAVVDKGLSENPEDRFQSAEEFREALNRCIASA
ncbi:serine/threonine protein kinase [Candidatus Micrarchaeota archaeon]|nr:serine/threonine protein kinase [Candidatus Micrarchaeota archaeon]